MAAGDSPLIIPEEYLENGDLVKCELSDLEREFSKSFPGKIETYRHDAGLVIFRQVYGATRKLHDSSACLLAGGFQLSEESEQADSEGRLWKTYTAVSDEKRVTVRSIVLESDTEKSWSGVEEWFWYAFFRGSNKRYIAITEMNKF